MLEFNALNTIERSEEGVEFEIKHPGTGKGTGAFITVRGVDSKFYKKTQKEYFKKISDTTTVEEIETQIAIACVIGWRGITENGKELRFSEDKLKILFESAPTIRDQTVAFQKDRSNFLAIASES